MPPLSLPKKERGIIFNLEYCTDWVATMDIGMMQRF